MADAQAVSMDSDTSEVMENEAEEEVDEAAHEKLLNSLFSLDGKKRNKNAIRGIPTISGNLDLDVHATKDSARIRLEDLDMKLKRPKVELKRPLNDVELEKAKREIAREMLAKDMSKWEPVVKEVRSAPQTIFSQRPHGIKMYEAVQPKPFTPRTPLEVELFEALGKSQDILKPNQELTAAETKALKAMSVKEARARRAELMKHHELLSRMELKAKRQKKIKSKRYRKILRKEKMANEKKELENLQKTDPEAFLEKIEEMERARIEERLTLKHRGGSKFARRHKVYSKFDDKTREAVQDMLQKSRELTKKRQNASSSEDEGEEDIDVISATKDLPDDDSDVDDKVNDPAKKAAERAKQLEILKALNRKAGGWLDGPKTTFVYAEQQTEEKESMSGESHSDTKRTEEIEPSQKDESEDKKDDTRESREKTSDQATEVPDTKSVEKAKQLEAAHEKETKKRKRSDDVSNTDSPQKNASKRSKVQKVTENKEADAKVSIQSSAQAQPSSDIRDLEDSDEEIEIVTTAQRLKSCETNAPTQSENIQKKTDEKGKKKKKKRNRKKKTNEESSQASNKTDKKQVKEITLQTPEGHKMEGDESDRDDGDGEKNELKVTMEELFQDEDVVEEFEKEKAEAEERNRPKIEDTKLPGWGSWAGPDYKDRNKKHKEAQKKKAQAMAKKIQSQQKIKQPTVWLNPNRNESIRKLQPKHVPFPYTSVQQYEASLRQPISRGFVRETAFKLLTKPEVVTKLGHIIKPMDKDDYFQDKKDIDGGDDGAFGSDNKDKVKSDHKGKMKQKRRTLR